MSLAFESSRYHRKNKQSRSRTRLSLVLTHVVKVVKVIRMRHKSHKRRNCPNKLHREYAQVIKVVRTVLERLRRGIEVRGFPYFCDLYDVCGDGNE